MIKVSIIMPSLNVGNYIENALESVINQSIIDIEVICIDAGSTDGTWEIIEHYSRVDNRITAIKTPIRSYGYQVNTGIRVASGEYIAILETDDYVNPDMYETLYETAKQYECDYVKADYRAYWTQRNGEKVFMHRKNTDDVYIYSKVLCPKDYTSLGLTDWYLWTGIYKKDFLTANKILFSESKGAAFQDVGFLLKTLQYAKRALYLDDVFYNYCIDREGASSNQNRSLLYSRAEFMNNINCERNSREENELFYARMARSFYLCVKEIGALTKEIEKCVEWFIEKIELAKNAGYISESLLGEFIWKEINQVLTDKERYFSENLMEEKKILATSSRNDIAGLFIFGCGNYGYNAYKWAGKRGLKLLGFTDNNKNLWNSEIDGIPVMSPVETAKKNDAMYLIANERYKNEIRNQLIEMGVSDDLIFEYR